MFGKRCVKLWRPLNRTGRPRSRSKLRRSHLPLWNVNCFTIDGGSRNEIVDLDEKIGVFTEVVGWKNEDLEYMAIQLLSGLFKVKRLKGSLRIVPRSEVGRKSGFFHLFFLATRSWNEGEIYHQRGKGDAVPKSMLFSWSRTLWVSLFRSRHLKGEILDRTECQCVRWSKGF